ncbi:hypothetical protein [Nodularia sp. UHCC 0506]|uniref:hypothetical protein n=1 Tax=Nodularia sp. UHCC 0506 TaxID=3110243 RepID=UPI002B21F8D8|nr:hypothetical protein [Nodularia sp. UHCC 0506]MEA5514836.1 hypothetical protein [Nodularia sp. UHCC 0506]
MDSTEKGFVTILTGLYSYQDCIHFIASVRKFHQEPIVIFIARVPFLLQSFLHCFKDVILLPAPSLENPVLASRIAKISLYEASPFEKTIFLDCDICLLSPIGEIFDDLNHHDLVITKDVVPCMTEAQTLLRSNQSWTEETNVVPIFQAANLPVTENTIHYNSGMMAFRRTPTVEHLFLEYSRFFKDVILKNQDIFRVRDQGALAAAIEVVKPNIKTLSPTYNFLSKWKEVYGTLTDPIKVLHCTYPLRPQYAKEVSRSFPTRLFDRIAKLILPNQTANPWRSSKADLP